MEKVGLQNEINDVSVINYKRQKQLTISRFDITAFLWKFVPG